MIRFALRRALHAAVLLVLISLCSFSLLELAPGNYVDAMRLDISISPDRAAALRSRYKLDQSLPTRYVSWLGSALRGQFGISFAYGMPVSSLLWPRMKNTLLLATTAAVALWTTGILLGVAAAITSSRLIEHLVGGFMSVLHSVPDLLIALVLLLLAVRTRFFPIGGMTGLIDSGSLFAHPATWPPMLRCR